jgi:hypothetical protein
MMTSSTALQFFIETHHYDGGLKVALFGTPSRPPGMPPSEAIYLDPDIELLPDETLIEYSRFITAESAEWTWIGCYARSVDRQYGDRSNYAAVGIWLNNALISENGQFVFAMIDGLRSLRAQGMTQSLTSMFEKFWRSSSEFVRFRSEYPAGCKGIVPTPSHLTRRVYVIADAARSDLQSSIDAAIWNLSLALTPFCQAPRVVIKVARTPPSANQPALPADRELLIPFVRQLPSVLEASATEYKTVSESYTRATTQSKSLETLLGDAKREFASLDAKYRALRDENKMLEDKVGALEKLPYTGISQQLADTKRELMAIRSSVESLRFSTPDRATALKPPEFQSSRVETAVIALIVFILVGAVGAISYWGLKGLSSVFG